MKNNVLKIIFFMCACLSLGFVFLVGTQLPFGRGDFDWRKSMKSSSSKKKGGDNKFKNKPQQASKQKNKK